MLKRPKSIKRWGNNKTNSHSSGSALLSPDNPRRGSLPVCRQACALQLARVQDLRGGGPPTGRPAPPRHRHGGGAPTGPAQATPQRERAGPGGIQRRQDARTATARGHDTGATS